MTGPGAAHALTCRPSLHVCVRFAGMDSLQSLEEYLQSSGRLDPGLVLTLLYRKDGTMEVVLSDSTAGLDVVVPGLLLDSIAVSRAIVEAYLGEGSIAPQAKRVWVGGARDLLDSDNERRKSRRSGAG